MWCFGIGVELEGQKWIPFSKNYIDYFLYICMVMMNILDGNPVSGKFGEPNQLQQVYFDCSI